MKRTFKSGLLDSLNPKTRLVRNNVFQGNSRGMILFKESDKNSNRIFKNTFWQNNVDVENLDKTAGSISAEPFFIDPNNGDFSLKAGPVLEQKQGLTNPEIFKKLWEKWKTMEKSATISPGG